MQSEQRSFISKRGERNGGDMDVEGGERTEVTSLSIREKELN